MFTHGIITGALFLLVGLIYDQRTHVRDFRELGGGLWRTVPRYGTSPRRRVRQPRPAGPGRLHVGVLVFRGAFGVGLVGNPTLLVLTALSVLGILFTAAFILWKVIQMSSWGPKTSVGSARPT